MIHHAVPPPPSIFFWNFLGTRKRKRGLSGDRGVVVISFTDHPQPKTSLFHPSLSPDQIRVWNFAVWFGDPLPICMIFAGILANFCHWQMRTSRGRGWPLFHSRTDLSRPPFSLPLQITWHWHWDFVGSWNSMSPLHDFFFWFFERLSH